MASLMLSNISIKENIVADEKYKYLFSVEEVNKLVVGGMPFRDAYMQVGKGIEAGNFKYDVNINHTHEGSAGNLCTAEIKMNMGKLVASFPFERIREAVGGLIA